MKPIIVSDVDENQEKRVNTRLALDTYTHLRRIQDYIRLNNKEVTPSLNDAVAFCIKYTYENKIKPDNIYEFAHASKQ